MQDEVYGYLGTSSSDKAFPPARVTRWLNNQLNALYADLPNGYLQQIATWAAASSASHIYTLWNQSVPVTGLRKILDLRIVDVDGDSLRECAYDQLENNAGLWYALSGADETVTITTCQGIDAGTALYAVHESWPAELAAASDVPSSLPKRFHDVPCLMAAKVGFSAGAESKWPQDLQEILEDRTAQFRAHVARRSADVMKQRTPVGVV